MKKFLFVIGGLLIVCISIGFSLVGVGKESRLYVAEEMPKILHSWSWDELYQRSSESLKGDIENSEFRDFWDWTSRLGAFQELESIECVECKRAFPGGTTATYKMHAKFEKGESEITTVVKKENKKWLIEGIHLKSSVPVRLYVEEV